MNASRPQSFANHRAIPPLLYLLAGFVLLAETLQRAWLAWQVPTYWSAWAVLVSAALLVVWYYSRRSAQIVQDRVIRLEMRLRLARVLAAEQREPSARLELRQLIALRFASDAELPGLVAEVLDEKCVEPDDIKRAVKDWQADWLRV